VKQILLLSVICYLLTGVSQAFWTNTDNLERSAQYVRIDDQNGDTEVVIEEWIKNNTETTQFYRYLAPIGSQDSNAQLFVDGNGLSKEIQTGPVLLENLWEYSQEHDQPDLLQLGNYHDQSVIISEPIEIVSGQRFVLKFKYITTPEIIDNIKAITVDVGDRIPTASFETSFNHLGSQPIKHLFPPARLTGSQLKEGNQVTWLSDSVGTPDNPAVNSHSLKFLWSNQDAKFSYRYAEHDYHLHLQTPPNPGSWETITILIDQSGSMFGDRWEHSQRLVKELLKKLPQSARIRIGFFDNEVAWFHELPVSNNHDEQKKFLEWWANQTPTGRTNWSILQEALQDLQLDQSALSKSAGVIIGDFEKFDVAESDYRNLKSFRRSLLLDFGSNDLAAFWSRLNDGQYQNIFSEDAELAQWPLIWQRWQSLRLPITPQTLRAKYTKHTDWWPQEINFVEPGDSLVWLSRSEPEASLQSHPQAHFLPALWAQHKTAGELRRQAITSLNAGKRLLLQAVTRGLGVDHPLLETALNEALSLRELWTLIWQLEQPKLHSNHFFVGAKPTLSDGSNQVSPDIDQFDLKSGIVVASGSVAQRQLFYFFPDLVGRIFSLGNNLKYCAERRCVAVNDLGETTPEETHKLDWRGYLRAHWANEFVLKLAQKNIVPIDPFGEMQLDEPITRGEFIEWLVKWYFGTDFTDRTAGISDPRFTDITDESTALAEAIYLLRRKGVIQGYPDGTVKPDRPLARAEAVKVLLALDGFEPSGNHEGELPFRDIGGWEAGWVVRAQQNGLVQGYGDGTFKPFQSLTRGEGMKLIVTFDP